MKKEQTLFREAEAIEIEEPEMESKALSVPNGQIEPAPARTFINEDGTLNPNAYMEPSARIKAFEELFPADKFNVIMFSHFLMSKIPNGTTLYPQIVPCRDEDLWTQKNAPEVVPDPNMAMPSAKFIIRIGQSAGVQLTKMVDRVVSIDGRDHLEILYSAGLRLPDGTFIQAPAVGKCQPLHTNKGYLQAHIRESTDIKARRNAIKELLTIPTGLDKNLAKRHWVVVKAIYDPNEAESSAVLKQISDESSAAADKLYPKEEDSPAKEDAKDLQDLKQRFLSAANMDELNDALQVFEEYRPHLDEWCKDAFRYYYASAYQRIKKGGEQ